MTGSCTLGTLKSEGQGVPSGMWIRPVDMFLTKPPGCKREPTTGQAIPVVTGNTGSVSCNRTKRGSDGGLAWTTLNSLDGAPLQSSHLNRAASSTKSAVAIVDPHTAKGTWGLGGGVGLPDSHLHWYGLELGLGPSSPSWTTCLLGW